MNPTDNRRISIITFWGVPNYGAFAQAYALNNVLKQMYPEYEVEHIGYLKKEHYDTYYTKKKPALIIEGTPKEIAFYKSIYRYFKRWIQFPFKKVKDYSLFKQAWSGINHIDILDEEKLEAYDWDMIVTGSDVVWQFSTAMYGVDYHLIGKGLKANKLIAYAASCGDQKGNLPNFASDMLNRYNAISVRDTFSKNLVEPLLESKEAVPIVLDPTLLYDFPNDPNIITFDKGKYIFVYGLWFKKETAREIKKYAKKHQLEIIGVGHAPEWCDKRINEIDPFAWIGMFKNAEFVVTDTFHGLMFCLIYNKRFYFYQQPYVRNRSAWILEKTGLDKLFLQEGFNLQKMLEFNWDYEKINDILKSYKVLSTEFIKKAIEE